MESVKGKLRRKRGKLGCQEGQERAGKERRKRKGMLRKKEKGFKKKVEPTRLVV